MRQRCKGIWKPIPLRSIADALCLLIIRTNTITIIRQFHYNATPVKYYAAPVLCMVVAVGILLGGYWMWLGFAVLVFVVVVGDAVFPDDNNRYEPSNNLIFEIPLYMAPPLTAVLLTTVAWSWCQNPNDLYVLIYFLGLVSDYDFVGARNGNEAWDHIGALLGGALIVAGYATTVAHELIHRTNNKWAVIQGRLLLSVSCNPDFSIEHVYGHHALVGMREDPATARYGENVYKFFIRSLFMGHFSAWQLELRRLHQGGSTWWTFDNRMLTGYLMCIAIVTLFYFAASWPGVLAFITQALLAKFILEVVNYMEHYGLERKPGASVAPEHSWNTNKHVSSAVLFSLTRHSAHHEQPRTRFWELNPYESAPQMPYGYLTTLGVCLIPPLWFRTIHPRLEKWRQNCVDVG